MAPKLRDPILDAIEREGLFGQDVRSVDLSKPFKEVKPTPEPGRVILPSSTYLANDLGKEIKLITGTGDKVINAGYLESVRLVAAQGLHLPSIVLHDDYLVSSDKWKELDKKGYYAAWAREILVYPGTGGTFIQGEDVIDGGTGWILPARYVPEDICGKIGMGLFIDPEDVCRENGRIIVHPKTTIILNRLLQERDAFGMVDEATRIPLETNVQLDFEKRWFWRTAGMSVRPICRGASKPNIRMGINCDCFPTSNFGVGGVEYK